MKGLKSQFVKMVLLKYMKTGTGGAFKISDVKIALLS
jgi:hypothetical protein